MDNHASTTQLSALSGSLADRRIIHLRAGPGARTDLTDRGDRGRVGWVLGAVIITLTVASLRHFEVPLRDSAVFLAYLVIGISLPGMLLWRIANRRAATLVEDLAAGTLLRPKMWISPTQTFGGLLGVPLVIVLVDLLSEEGRGWRRWPLLLVLPCAVMGAKATYLPLLLGGLTLVVLLRLLRRRQLSYPALGAAAMALCCRAFATLRFRSGPCADYEITL